MALFPINLVVNLLHLLVLSVSWPALCVWSLTHDPINPSHIFASGLIYMKTKQQSQTLKPHSTRARLVYLKRHIWAQQEGKEETLSCSLIDLFFSELQHHWTSFITAVFCRTLTSSDRASEWFLCMPLSPICPFVFWGDISTGTKVSSWRMTRSMGLVEEGKVLDLCGFQLILSYLWNLSSAWVHVGIQDRCFGKCWGHLLFSFHMSW